MLGLKSYNLSTFFGAEKQTDFLDAVINVFDVGVCALLVVYIVYDSGNRGIWRSRLLWLWMATVLIGVAQIFFFADQAGWVQMLKILLVSTRLWVCVAAVWAVFQTQIFATFWRVFFAGSMALAVLFDKFLLYNPRPAFMLGLLGVCAVALYSQSWQWRRILFTSYMFVGGFIAASLLAQIWQITTASSIGFAVLGESVLSIDTPGVAREQIAGLTFLRGYGLAEHASSMGFMGSMGILFAMQLRDFRHDIIGRWWKLLLGISGVVAVLSLSRSVLLVLIIAAGWYVWNLQKPLLRIALGVMVELACIVMIGHNLIARQQSNSMRLEELGTLTQAVQRMTPAEQAFGIGLGQYPYFVQTHFTEEEIPYYRIFPVHNTALNIAVDLGVFVSIGLCVAVYVFKPMQIGRKSGV